MKKVDFMRTDDEFMSILHLIIQFAKTIDDPFWKQVQEVTQCFNQFNWHTLIGWSDGKVGSYLCGYLMNTSDFMVTQILSGDPELTDLTEIFLENFLRECKVERILGLSIYPPAIEEHGYKVIRYLMEKRLIPKED